MKKTILFVVVVILALSCASRADSPEQRKAPVGWVLERGVNFLTDHFTPGLRLVSAYGEAGITRLFKWVLYVHWAVIIVIISVLCFLYQRSIKHAILVAFGLLLIVNLGLWVETIKTLTLVVLSSFLAISVGVPVGVMAARKPWFHAALRPLLDLIETIPTFVYLIPTLMLFGLGLVPGLIFTVMFVIAVPIRFTYLGLISVPRDLVEASRSFGATKLQTLLTVELPCARPSIVAGFSQCIMLALSMVVIAALIGMDGLGTPVVRALNSANLVPGFESGIAIIILAILLDRTLNPKRMCR